MGSSIDPIPNYFPPANILMISCLSEDPLYKNKFFLQQKYVEERLSCEEIAAEVFSARTTILKYLRLHNISIREVGSKTKRVRGLAYGQRIKERSFVEHKREQEAIIRIRELRNKGFSFWRIGDILNTMKLPTKTRKGRWHARTIQAVLLKNE